MSQLAIYLLGSPRVELDGGSIRVNTRKAIALIAYLAVTAGIHSRESLTTLLWPELDRRRGRAALRSTLSVLKKALVGDWLLIQGENISLEAGYWCDAVVFAHELTTCSDATILVDDDCVTRLTGAIDMYQGDFMAGFTLSDSVVFDEWQFFQADALRVQLANALSRLAKAYTARREFEMSIQHVRRRLVLDPLYEPAHRQLMRLYAMNGQRSSALRQYRRLTQLLANEIQAEPDAATTALNEQIQDGNMAIGDLETGEDRQPSPVATRYSLTPFVGRQSELSQIQARLADDGCRLLTLVGVGGIGKTRLALETAAAHPGEAVFVRLASVSDAGFLVATIADALGFSFYGQAAPDEQLFNYLREKKLLLVLDNFEHLLSGAGLLLDILSHAPAVKLLVTSRERLHLTGEWIFEIKGLAVPPDAKAETAVSYEAIQLFMHHVRRLAPDADLAGSWPDIARICQLLGGMPLGIELAAVWVRTLTCGEIKQEIERNLDFLITSQRDVPERHRSLRAVFNHSWHLLTPAEQRLFCQLSLFRGGFSREAALAVTGASVSLLAALVDKSLLRYNHNGRYKMPEALRPYGVEARQENPDMDTAVTKAHCHYYTTFLQAQENDLIGGRQGAALAEIAADIENIRSAWRWAVSQQDEMAVANALDTLFRFYDMRSLFQEGIDAFSTLQVPFSTLLISKALAYQGHFHQRLGQYETANTCLEASLDMARELDAEQEIAFALNSLGYVAWSQGEYDRAHHLYQGSLHHYRAQGDLWGMSRVLNNLAIMPQDLAQTRTLLQESLELVRQLGDLWGEARVLNNLGIALETPAKAKESYQACVTICQQIGDRFLMTFPLINLGHTARLAGEFERAHTFYAQSLTICREIGYRAGVARCLGHLGTAAYCQGHYVKSRQRCEDGLLISQEIGDQRGVGWHRYTLGDIALVEADWETAVSHYRHSLSVFRQAHDTPGIAWPLLGLAKVALQRDEIDKAQQLAHESWSIFRQVGDQAGVVQAGGLLGQLACHQDDMDAARDWFEQALETAVSLPATPLILATFLHIASWHQRQHLNEHALMLTDFVRRQAAVTAETKTQAARLRAELAAQVDAKTATTVSQQNQDRVLEDVVTAVWH